jgi:hypothetical protein
MNLRKKKPQGEKDTVTTRQSAQMLEYVAMLVLEIGFMKNRVTSFRKLRMMIDE